MNAKKILAGVLVSGMVLTGAAAVHAEEGAHIYVLTASEDHGWTGSVATFAKEKAEELNAEGTYSAEVITAASASDQITQIEDILAGVKGLDRAFLVVENRRAAIARAMSEAKKDDIIVLCGKGHETYQILGTVKTHLDEREEVAKNL